MFLLTSYGYAVEYRVCVDSIGREYSKGILEKKYRVDLSLEEAKALAVKAVLRKKARAENILIASIDAKTKNFTDATIDERKRLLAEYSRDICLADSPVSVLNFFRVISRSPNYQLGF